MTTSNGKNVINSKRVTIIIYTIYRIYYYYIDGSFFHPLEQLK